MLTWVCRSLKNEFTSTEPTEKATMAQCGSPQRSKWGGASFIDLLASPAGSHLTGDGSLRFTTRTTTTRTVVRTTTEKETTVITTVLRISPPGKPAPAQPALAFSASSASTAQHAQLHAFLAHVERWRAEHTSRDFASDKCALACAADWVRAASARGARGDARSGASCATPDLESEGDRSSQDELNGALDGALDGICLEEDDAASGSWAATHGPLEEEEADGGGEDSGGDNNDQVDGDSEDADGESSDDHSPMLRWVDPAHLCVPLPASPGAAFDAAPSGTGASTLALSPRQRAVQRLNVSAREAWRGGRSSVFGGSVRDVDKLRCCVCSYVIVVGAVAAESYAFVCGACQQQLQPAALSPHRWLI